jgi:DNA ligase (NAD+)
VLEGITVVATGTLEGYTREGAGGDHRRRRQGGVERLEEDRLRRRRTGAGSKLAKAEELGIRIIDAAQFRILVEQGPAALDTLAPDAG